MARHTLHSDLVLLELFMQQENLFKESSLGDDSVHLEWLFCKWCFAEMGVNSGIYSFFFSIGSIIDLPLISIFTVFFI